MEGIYRRRISGCLSEALYYNLAIVKLGNCDICVEDRIKLGIKLRFTNTWYLNPVNRGGESLEAALGPVNITSYSEAEAKRGTNAFLKRLDSHHWGLPGKRTVKMVWWILKMSTALRKPAQTAWDIDSEAYGNRIHCCLLKSMASRVRSLPKGPCTILLPRVPALEHIPRTKENDGEQPHFSTGYISVNMSKGNTQSLTTNGEPYDHTQWLERGRGCWYST